MQTTKCLGEVPATLLSALPPENHFKLKILATPMCSRLQDGCQSQILSLVISQSIFTILILRKPEKCFQRTIIELVHTFAKLISVATFSSLESFCAFNT